MFVVSVCSLKGGVGKTSVVLGLAAAALADAKTVLVVDLDPQGDATYALGSEPADAVSADVLQRPKRKVLAESIVASTWSGPGEVHVIPSSPETAALDRPEVEGEHLHTLRRALGKLEYDLVLIDAPPSLAALTRSALVASDRALVVAEPGAFAVNAASRLFTAIDDVRRREAGALQPLGIIVNRYRPALTEHRAQLQALERTFGPLVLTPPLPERSGVARAQGARRPLGADRSERDLLAEFTAVLRRIQRAERAIRRHR